MNKIIKSIGIGLIVGAGFFLLFGIVTALIPNIWYKRMILPTDWDYIVLILNSLLIGAYVGLSVYKRNIDNKCDYITTSGGIFGVFAFGCPICSTLLVSLFGVNALMIYFNPYRPFLGLLSIGLLGSVVIFKIIDIKKYHKKKKTLTENRILKGYKKLLPTLVLTQLLAIIKLGKILDR